MNLHDVTALAVKAAGLVLLVILLSKVPEYVHTYASVENSTYDTSSIYYIMPLLIVGIGCLALIFIPYKITKITLFQEPIASSKDSVRHLQIIAIRLLGLLLLFWSVSDTVFHLFNYFMLRDLSELDLPLQAYNYPLIIATAAELVFAVVLIKQARRISRWLDTTCN